jgi:hypothetical protein
MPGPAEATALPGFHPRAARRCEPQQKLEIVGGLLVRLIRAYSIGEVRDRSVDLALRSARR